jgi:phospholipase C
MVHPTVQARLDRASGRRRLRRRPTDTADEPRPDPTLSPGAPGGYDRYGFRVPAVVISPYARADFVSSTVFDHTSVLKRIEEKWNLPSLTRRDAAATAPWEMLDLEGPPTFLSPPSLPGPAVPHLWRSPPPSK